MDPRRWTPWTMLVPWRYVDRDEAWTDFEFRQWATESYDWVSDPWNGYLDLARRPWETVADERGDCEDFALVAVSWAIANDREGVGLAFCWEVPYPWPRHVIAYDEEYVYSSGDIERTGVSEWVEDSKYAFALRRRVR